MSKQREALQLALEALTEVTGWQWAGPMRVMDEVEDAIAAIHEALAEPEQGPVAWMLSKPDRYPAYQGYNQFSFICDAPWDIPLYTAPPARKPLTDSELWEMWVESPSDVLRFARAIERAHGIGD